MRTRVKICCMSSPEEAMLAVRHGADAIGLVGKMPSGPGVIEDEAIRRIAAAVPPPIGTFLLTSEVSAQGIVNHYKRALTNTIQIVDYIDAKEYPRIRSELPWVRLVQVIHVEDRSAIERALAVEEHVDAILLDSGRPNAETKILGGTGEAHDWEISREIVRTSRVPVFLAGGIRPENAAEAVELVRPYGIDVCTGVRTNGYLDETKLIELFTAVTG